MAIQLRNIFSRIVRRIKRRITRKKKYISSRTETINLTTIAQREPCHIILDEKFGHALSRKEHRPIDAKGEPIPWYTYPAIEYIRQLDFSNSRIFEYGAGYSSLFWAGIADTVISVEKSSEWAEEIADKCPDNLTLLTIPDNPQYEDSILGYGEFDVIVIDGSERLQCANRAVKSLCSGGMIILDNSDWYTKAAGVLREDDFIQVDMSGFGPINQYTWSTSFFLRRDFAIRSRSLLQPVHGIGALEVFAPEEELLE